MISSPSSSKTDACPISSGPAFAAKSDEYDWIEKADGTCLQLWYCGDEEQALNRKFVEKERGAGAPEPDEKLEHVNWLTSGKLGGSSDSFIHCLLQKKRKRRGISCQSLRPC